MANLWINVARILVPIEALAGMVLNLVLIFTLIRSYIIKEGRLYYYSCIITAILSFCTALVVGMIIPLPTVIDGNVVAAFYGPLMFYFPEWANTAIFLVFCGLVHTMWQILPAQSILQWLAISKSNRSNLMKMALAYSVPFTSQIISLNMMTGFLPSDELRAELTACGQRMLGSNLSEFHVYGVRMKDENENNWDGLDYAIFDLIPSFLVSYSIFAVIAVKIRSKLVSLGVSISEKTKQMQLRFFLLQIAQVLLPLVLTSVPLGSFAVAALMGTELRSFPFLLAVMMWPMPMLTALIYLGFVRKTAIKRSARQSKMSFSLSKNGESQRKTSTNQQT